MPLIGYAEEIRMVSTLPIAFVVLLIACGSAEPDPTSYVDLGADPDACASKIYPHRLGETCPSGEFDHFTIRRLTEFGERPVWSPEGRTIAFVDKEFGDVHELELASGTIRCLTCDFANEGFLRVHYMKDGDYLLLGPKEFTSPVRSRLFHTGFFWMPADRSAPPRWLGEEHYEGVAVSRESRSIGYARTWLDTLFLFPSRLYVAEVTPEGEIVNRREVSRSIQIIEAQDFLPGDRGLIFSRYTPSHEVLGIDFETGEVTNYSQSPGSDEPEGLFPDGRFTLVESDRHARKRGNMDLDIYMLRLDGTGSDVRRLTRFSDQPGEKASNPVVSPEGCRVAFMKAKESQEGGSLTGAGDGIFLLEFFRCAGPERAPASPKTRTSDGVRSTGGSESISPSDSGAGAGEREAEEARSGTSAG
jgi:hypothetical protein